MALKAIIPAGMTEITVNGLHQWDYGQELEIHAVDLNGLVEVHFACAGMNDAVVRPCNMVGGEGKVAIPDACLEQTAPIMAWVYEKDGATGATVKTITLRVTPRARPTTSEAPPPEVIDPYTEAVTAMNDAVGKVADGRITAAKAVEAVVDSKGNLLEDNYHLNPITKGNDKYLIGSEVNIDTICKPSMCGVYTINWDTIRDYDIPTLPRDIPTGGCAGKLIVEADYNVDGKEANTVFQTLKMRVLTDDANQRLMLWTRQCVDGTWSRWLRHVSAEELTDGTLKVKNAETAMRDSDGNLLAAALQRGGFTVGGASGYHAMPLMEDSFADGLIEPGIVAFQVRVIDSNSRLVDSVNLIIDLIDQKVMSSNIFTLLLTNSSLGEFRLQFEQKFEDVGTAQEPEKRMYFEVSLYELYQEPGASFPMLMQRAGLGRDMGIHVNYKYLSKYSNIIGG